MAKNLCAKTTMKVSYIIFIICGFVIFILSLIEIVKGYGYKNILSILGNFEGILGKKNNYCEEYISEIKTQKRLAQIKTMINILFNLYQFIYFLLRLKNLDKSCKIGLLFFFILLFGHVCEIILTSNSYGENDVTEYLEKCLIINYTGLTLKEDSSFEEAKNIYNLVNKLDITIIVFIGISLLNITFAFFCLLYPDCSVDKCFEKDFFLDFSFICERIENCSKRQKCFKIFKGNDSTSLKNENIKLLGEINNLKNNIRNLKNEIYDLKKQKNINENNFNFERKKFKEKANKNHENKDDENHVLKQEVVNLRKEIEKLKYKNRIIKTDLKKMENKLIQENKELNQLKVIEFYVKKEITSINSDKNNRTKKFVLRELENIKYNYGLNLDSDKFREIALYYIKSKLLETLTDPKTKNIFSFPVISPEGKTYEKDSLEESNDYIENKLVSEICKILKESEDKLNMENFKNIKKLLISKETDDFYNNPIVIISEDNKGETVEDIENENNIGYENKVIKIIIGDIGELLNDEFFKFKIIESDDDVTENYNNHNNDDNAFNISGFAEV